MIILPSHSILLPKYRGIPDPTRPILVGKAGYSGECRIILYDESMQTKHDTGWFPNLITNQGLNGIRDGKYNINYRMAIGDSTTAADFTDTALGNYLAEASSVGAGNGAWSGGSAPDYESWLVQSRRFAQGVATGNISEASLCQDNGGAGIWNRVVFTPIPKAADQSMDVLFKITLWPPVVDEIGVSTIEGVAYNTVTRGRNYPINGGSGPWPTDKCGFSTSYAAYAATNGVMGPITGSPSGTNVQAGGGFSVSVATYVTDDFFIDAEVVSGLEGWTTSTNEISAMRFSMENFSGQCSFAAVSDGSPIPKTINDLFTMHWRFAWGRK